MEGEVWAATSIRRPLPYREPHPPSLRNWSLFMIIDNSFVFKVRESIKSHKPSPQWALQFKKKIITIGSVVSEKISLKGFHFHIYILDDVSTSRLANNFVKKIINVVPNLGAFVGRWLYAASCASVGTL